MCVGGGGGTFIDQIFLKMTKAKAHSLICTRQNAYYETTDKLKITRLACFAWTYLEKQQDK